MNVKAYRTVHATDDKGVRVCIDHLWGENGDPTDERVDCERCLLKTLPGKLDALSATLEKLRAQAEGCRAAFARLVASRVNGGAFVDDHFRMQGIFDRFFAEPEPVQNTSELRAEFAGVDLADGPDLTGVFIPAASQVKEQVLGLAVWCLHCDDEFPPGRNLVHNCPDRPERHGSSFTSHAEHRKKKTLFCRGCAHLDNADISPRCALHNVGLPTVPANGEHRAPYLDYAGMRLRRCLDGGGFEVAPRCDGCKYLVVRPRDPEAPDRDRHRCRCYGIMLVPDRERKDMDTAYRDDRCRMVNGELTGFEINNLSDLDIKLRGADVPHWERVHPITQKKSTRPIK